MINGYVLRVGDRFTNPTPRWCWDCIAEQEGISEADRMLEMFPDNERPCRKHD